MRAGRWGKLYEHRRRRNRVPIGVIKALYIRAQGRCERCGVPLQNLQSHIHHRDMNTRNNDLSNLELLCPNCHYRNGVHTKPVEVEEEKIGMTGEEIFEAVFGHRPPKE
jgi:5-methylcytosine-specific restriction endonuclease McrA